MTRLDILIAVADVMAELDDSFGVTKRSMAWMKEPNTFLNGQRPYDVMVEKDFDSVLAALDQLKNREW